MSLIGFLTGPSSRGGERRALLIRSSSANGIRGGAHAGERSVASSCVINSALFKRLQNLRACSFSYLIQGWWHQAHPCPSHKRWQRPSQPLGGSAGRQSKRCPSVYIFHATRRKEKKKKEEDCVSRSAPPSPPMEREGIDLY